MEFKYYSKARATSYGHLGYIYTTKPLSNTWFPLLHPNCNLDTPRAG